MAFVNPVSPGLLFSGGGPAAAAAAVPGLNALLLPFLLSFGPSFLNKLFGRDENKDLRERIAMLSHPNTLRKVSDQFFQTAISSPAYSSALGSIATGANQTANQVASSLAARGIGTSGTGAVLSGLTPSLVGKQTGDLKAEAFRQAQQQTENWLRAQIDALMGTRGKSETQRMFGAGLDAFGPYLSGYLRQRYPNLFPNVTQPPAATPPR